MKKMSKPKLNHKLSKIFNLYFLSLLLLTLPSIVYSYVELRPDDFQPEDAPFRDDIEYPTEKYHHIIDAQTVRFNRTNKGYIDWYNGIYYRNDMYCYWEKDDWGWRGYSKVLTLSNYTGLFNINATNLRELHHYGCHERDPVNLLFDNKREADDAAINLTIRITNMNIETDLKFTLCECASVVDGLCKTPTVLDPEVTVPAYNFIIYKFSYDGFGYYLYTEGLEIVHSETSFAGNSRVQLFFEVTEGTSTDMVINSFILSTDMHRYVLALSGHVHNYCSDYGCVSSDWCHQRSSPEWNEHYCHNGGGGYSEYYDITECSLRGCIPGGYCNDHSICIECDKQCRTCFDSTQNNCKSCFSTAKYPQWQNYHQFQTSKLKESCVFQFYPLNKIRNNAIDFPIPLNYRMTFEMWVFIHQPLKLTNEDLTPSLSSFVIKDFFTISIHQHDEDINAINIIFTPFEFFYPFLPEYNIKVSFEENYLATFPSLQFLKIDLFNVTSKWVYIKGGISYTHYEYFLNEITKELEPLPYISGNDSLTYKFLMRKYYRKEDKTSLSIQGFQFLNTDIYVRNLNFYSEYMKGNVNGPNYFNMHTINDVATYPQLFFSIPFDDVIVDSKKMITTYTVYDYSTQYIDEDTNEVRKVSVESTWVRDYLAPSKNFFRLNFLDFGNTQYQDTDLTKKKDIICDEGTYCFDDNAPYICKTDEFLFLKPDPDEFYNDTECVTSCLDTTDNSEYMRLPAQKTYKPSGAGLGKNMCIYKCDPDLVDSCPKDVNVNIKTFQCKNNYTSFFYRCYDNETYPPEKSALEFSGTMNTKSIVFPFNRELHNFIIEVWFHPDLLHQENPPIVKKYIFMTNNHLIYYDVSQSQFLVSIFIDSIESTLSMGQKIYYYGWNHLIFYAKEETTKGITITTFSISITNNFVTIGDLQGVSTANKLCFCNKDENCCDRVSDALWYDVFLKEIKIWDATYVNPYTLIDADKFNYLIPGGLLQHYILTMDKINYNVIVDEMHPSNKSYNAIFPSDDKGINPDDDMLFNVAWDFNWNDINYPNYILSTKLLPQKNRVQIYETRKCYEGCEKCFGEDKHSCFSCNEGYGRNIATCTRTTKDESVFYFLNPLMPDEHGNIPTFELDFDTLHISSRTPVTLFFYIKIYGFTKAAIDRYETDGSNFDLITFNTDRNFKLVYNFQNDKIILVIDTDIELFSYVGLIGKFGEWIPVSLAIFRSSDTSFQKHFSSMTIGDTLLPYTGFIGTDEYRELPLKEFKVSKQLICHIAEVTLFNTFIINAFGYASHKDLEGGKFSYDTDIVADGYIIKTFKLRVILNETSLGSNKCVEESDLLDPSILPYIKCVEDYLSLTDQTCDDNQFVQANMQNTPPICVSEVSKCDNIEQVVKVMKDNCDYLYASCDTKSTNSINNLIFTYSPQSAPNDKYIVCGDANGLDLARFKPDTVHGVASPTKEFKMEFWFMQQSYVGINFGSITINWKDHIKIEVGYDHTNNRFYAKCIPVGDEAHTVTFTYNEIVVDYSKWRYVVCGANLETNEVYISNLMEGGRGEGSFTPTTTLSEGETDLYIAENSPDNFGVSYIKELRLWKCYDCSSDRAFVDYSRDDLFFDDVTNYFMFESSTGFLQDYKGGVPHDDIATQFETKTTFNGYGLLGGLQATPNCNEGSQLYYSVKTGKGCDNMYNFNIFKNDTVFQNIPASRENRYTIEFWFYVEHAEGFDYGMNIIYQDHIAVSTYAETPDDNNLNIYCFPQAYRDRLNDVFGENITTAYNNAQNKAKTTIVNSFSKWIYVRCAYSYDLLKYYINDETPQDVDSEIFFGSLKNGQAFKMFMHNYVNLTINLSRDNFVRVFIQNINIYRDYIPQIIETKYIKMNQYLVEKMGNYYYPILFSVNFEEGYNVIKDTLNYYVSDYDKPQEGKTVIEHFLLNVDKKSYPTYPTYDPFLLCDYGKKYFTSATGPYCEYIKHPNNCDKQRTFCFDENKFFWCKKGLFLNIETLQCQNDCPPEYTIPPDIVEGYGICYIKGADKHYSEWPYLSSDLKKGIYENKFKCIPGYTLVNYHCIPNSLKDTSALYFNSKYKFSNMVANYRLFDIYSYFVDFWFMFDLSEKYRFVYSAESKDESQFTIFIAYPHFISRIKNKIKYSNGFILLDTYDIIDVDEAMDKWNHVVIEFYETPGKVASDNIKNVNIYWNEDYTNPKLSLQLKNSNNWALSQIAFCHENNDGFSPCNLGLKSSSYKIFAPIWDDVYIKDIKVWNRNTTSFTSINSFGSSLNKEITSNIVSYHPFTFDTIKPGKVESLVNYFGNSIDFLIRYNTENVYDQSAQENWVSGFDITMTKKYINSIDVSTYTNPKDTPYFSRTDTTFDVQPCDSKCSKCFDDTSEKCFQCVDPNVIYNSECINSTGYYFKVPSGNKEDNPTIKIKNLDLSLTHELTFMFYMKFLGTEEREETVPIIYFYNELNYLGWDNYNESFVLNIKENDLPETEEETLFLFNNSRIATGIWAHYSVSILVSQYQGVFPNMIQVMINDIMMEPLIPMKDLHLKPVLFNEIKINNKISAAFYDFRIYNKYLIGAYALGQSLVDSSYSAGMLIKRLTLKSSSTDCVQSGDFVDLVGGNVFSCVPDDNPFDNPVFTCPPPDLGKEIIKIIDVSMNTTVNCIECNDYCSSLCISENNNGCLCEYDSRIYWLRYNFDTTTEVEEDVKKKDKNKNTENETKKVFDNNEKIKFYCEKPDSLNVNEYDEITIPDIDLGSEKSYMVELWFYVHSYIKESNFKGVSIIWKNFIRIDFNYFSKEYLSIISYPYSEDLSIKYTNNSINFNKWIFHRVEVNKEGLEMKAGDYRLSLSDCSGWSRPTGKTELKIIDKSGGEPFGLFLLRELRLWETKNNLLSDTAHLNLNPDNYQNLLHYFKNKYNTTNNGDPSLTNPRSYIYDSKKDKNTTITPRASKYGYSYIPNDYTDIVLCDEGTNYKITPEGEYVCQIVDESEIIENLEKDETIYTPDDLQSKTEISYEKAYNNFNASGFDSSFSDIDLSPDGNVIIKDPVINDHYCSQKGMIRIVDKTMTCYCTSEAIGKYCHLNATDYSTIQLMHETFFHKLESTFDTYIKNTVGTDSEQEKAFKTSLDNLLQGLQLFVKETSLVRDLSTFFHTKVASEIKTCLPEYIKYADDIYSTSIFITNSLKAGLMCNNKGTERNADLSAGQEDEFEIIVGNVKADLEKLTALCFPKALENGGYWNYKSENLNVDLYKWKKNGDPNYEIDKRMKEDKESKYQPFFQFDQCMNTAKEIDGSNYINVQYITWYYSPYYYSSKLYYNYTSDYIEVKLYSDDLQEISIGECKDKTNITFYLTLTNPLLIDIINKNKEHFKEENIYKAEDRIFSEPIYIEDDGSVNNMTLEERRKKYYFEYLLIFKTFDQANKEFKEEGMLYNTLEDRTYFKCSSSHLSEFLLTYQYNPYPANVLNRFYFLTHFNLYYNVSNFNGNYGFIFIIIVIGLYFFNFIIVKIYLACRKKKLGGKNYKLIEEFLMDYTYSYGNSEGDYFIHKKDLNKIYNLHKENLEGEPNNNNNKDNVTKANKEDEVEIDLNGKRNLKKYGKEKPELMKLKDNFVKDIDLFFEGPEMIDEIPFNRRQKTEEYKQINFGDIKNKKVYQKYFEKLGGDALSEESEEEEEKASSELNEEEKTGKVKTPEKNIDSKDKLVSSPDKGSNKNKNKANTNINNKSKANKIKNNNFISYNKKEEIKESEEYLKNKIKLKELKHSLLIYNQDFRCRNLNKIKYGCCQFFCINIKNRIIFFNTFKGNFVYSASVKALCFPLYLLILLFVNTFIFICLEEDTDYMTFIKSNTIGFVWRCLIPVIVVNIYFYATRYFYNIDNGKVRVLLYEFKTSKKSFDKDFVALLKKIKKMVIIETILFFLLTALTYVFVFGLCAVYKPQGRTMFVSLICGLVVDLVLNFITEIIIGLVYLCRKSHVLVVLLDYLNRIKSYKMLSP